MKNWFLSLTIGGDYRRLQIVVHPFKWAISRCRWTTNIEREHRIYFGPFCVFFTRYLLVALTLITGSIASAASPPWTGTPPNAIYRQPVQITRYQPGVRTYYRSQHVIVPGFGTIITNEYRHAPTYNSRTRPTGSYQPRSYSRSIPSTTGRSYGHYPYSR